jgi:hypothetical protein
VSGANLRELRRLVARVRAGLPAPSVAAELQAAVLRFAVVIERWAMGQPGYSPIPKRMMAKLDRAALAGWDGDGKLPISPNPTFASLWLERLAHHLRLPGWRDYLFDQAYIKMLSERAILAKTLGSTTKGWPPKNWPPLPKKNERALVLKDVAQALVIAEASGGSPSWVPGRLLEAARAENASHAAILSLNTEQAAKRMAELMAKATVQP